MNDSIDPPVEETLANETGPVTVVITHNIKLEQEVAFKIWLKGISKEAGKWPGFMGVQVIEPHSKGERVYVIIV